MFGWHICQIYIYIYSLRILDRTCWHGTSFCQVFIPHYNDVSNHQPHDCLLNRLFRRKSKKTSKLHVTGLCPGNSPVNGELPAPMASNAEHVSIWWRHHIHGFKWWRCRNFKLGVNWLVMAGQYEVYNPLPKNTMILWLAECMKNKTLVTQIDKNGKCFVPCYGDVTWVSWRLKITGNSSFCSTVSLG